MPVTDTQRKRWKERSEYINSKGKVIQKYYYDNYQYLEQYYLPLRMTEFVYTAKGDSIVTMKEYSNIQSNVTNNLIDFKIPSDAKIKKN